ncbi:MAG: septal ring lytic transglycosylase RlpA family protein [Hyphomonadaceae bacterium]
MSAYSAVLAVCVSALAFAASAHAQAPIQYAGQGVQQSGGPANLQLASVDARLAGGAENSYGYGARAPAQRQGAVIDIRRGGGQGALAEPAAPQPAPAQLTEARTTAEEGAAPWLERERVGPPYEVDGRWYVPTPEPGYEQTGMASWYGPQFQGQATASGEVFDQEALTAAHPTLPIPSLAQVTNLENGREIIVRINDRGPFVGDRLIDLSRRSAEVLGFESAGQARVHVRYLGPAPRQMNAQTPALTSPAPVQAPAPAPSHALAQQDGPMPLTPAADDDEHEFAGAPLAMPPATQLAQPPHAHPSGEGYFVQVGAFSDLMNAHRVRADIASAGPVAVDTRQTASGELFRVRLGPYTSRYEADAARQSLAGLGYGDAIVAAR